MIGLPSAARASPASCIAWIRRIAQPMSGLMAWIYLYLLLLLGAWVMVGIGTTGWTPVVVTSGSMQPTIRPGDVILVDRSDDVVVAQRTVLTFRSADDPDRLVTHRVFSVEADRFITKGDANPTPDTDPVSTDAVVGVGRLVVPLVGLPIVWANEGNVGALGSWVVLTAGAITVVAIGLRGVGRLRRDRRSTSRSPMTSTAVRRVRSLVIAMIVSQYVIDAGRFDIAGSTIQRWQILAGVVAVLIGLNGLSLLGARSPDSRLAARITVIELVIDTVIVVALATATGTSGIGWVLFALPIIEAAARFRLVGALVHWMALTALVLTSRIWMIERTAGASGELIVELERMLDQLSVLLLVVIPGAYLVEQLTTDILAQRKATQDAVTRSRLLQHVAETSREVNRLGTDVFATILDAVAALGFDRADVSIKVGERDWAVLSSVGLSEPSLPSPGAAGSGLRPHELAQREIYIATDDPDADDAGALAAAGIRLLVRLIVSSRDDTLVVLRAATAHRSMLHPGTLAAIRLLSGQATVALQNEQLVAELREVHDKMEYQANHDSLTGLPNRAAFLDHLGRSLAQGFGPAGRHAVLFLDLDGFKMVNDSRGHEAGDRLLEAVARRLEGVARDIGIVARLGGDEFTILLEPITDPGVAEEVAHRIHGQLAAPFRIGADLVQVSTSIGIAHAEADVSASELLRRADAAMYTAKAKGDEVTHAVYHPSLDAADRRRTRLADEFHRALRSGDLDLHYQPIVDPATARVAGVEALLRWTHPVSGPIPPLAVLQLAESLKLMPELNRWILGRAAEDTLSWRVPHDHDFFVAVNASPDELASASFVPNVANALAVSGLRPHNLVIELSERMIGDDTDHATTVRGLTQLGVRLALDDFGEGKTSLAHLRGLPIAILKLDLKLVQQAVRSKPDLIILESVTSLAHELGYTVIAEGIETKQHEQACVAAGADLLQGYLYHRPLPADQVGSLLAADTGAAAGRQASHAVEQQSVDARSPS